ncbi:acid sphingomyelinase-like phosphodiesterase [Legionella drozanskii LLAP-1]|uniref:Acid sphingomyelinase-like phosphodiesterase n=2 Tax=Legionellaceae TaxID=444 RepID=A0A0W0SVI4_9GAMM|nr:acid sphingomyelinase-like phosphodiesterase [Legionella drozanskii LLAP-1]PJE08505.1 MAG: metallophosphatase [Legionella sp.]
MFLFFLRVLSLILVVQTCFSSTRFLTISDIHYGSKTISDEGHDTNDSLLQLAMTKFTQLTNAVDFIIYLGDLPAHGYYPAVEKENYEKIVFQNLYQANKTAKPMFYVAGNNDSLLGNYQPFSSNGRSPLSLAEDWNGACANCEGLIINDEHMHDGGYYSTYVMPNNDEVLLIALNSTQFADLSSRFIYYPNQKKDALMQLYWLSQQLSQHHAKQLLIAMHIPPGNDYLGNLNWDQAYLEQFLQLLKYYQSHYQQITLLTSHSHMDEIRKISFEQAPNIYAFSTPAISRIHYNNTAMKIFKLDKNSNLGNFTTYYTRSNQQWLDEQYTAIHNEGIFRDCENLNLASCLDSLNQEQICANIEKGKYYGVKAEQVKNSACRKIYQIN